MATHCYACHGPDAKEAGLRLDTLDRGVSEAENFTRWAEVYERVAAGEMPPADHESKPAPAERAAFLASLKQTLLASEEQRRAADGRVVLRRLNREEYQNTLRDLFGIDVEVQDFLPEDAAAEGFDNISAALSMSSVLLERYLEAADAALDAVLVQGPRPETRKWRVSLLVKNPQKARLPRTGIKVLPDDTVVLFNNYESLGVGRFEAPVKGRYRFRISQSAYQSAGQPLTIAWYGSALDKRSLDARLIGFYDVPPDKPVVTEFIERMPVKGSLRPRPYGLVRGESAVKNTEGYEGPGVAVHWVEVEGPLIEAWPPTGYTRMLGNARLDDGTLADAEQALRNLAPRAFRRAITDEDVAPYLALVRTAFEEKKPFDEALRDGLKGMLCAPDFLFLREPPGPLDDFALASRLSYFLWSSMPDDALFAVAREGKLKSPGVLHAQVERMLGDAKAQRFIENFTGQWLGLRNINFTTPNTNLYPEFDEALVHAMVQETQLFFAELLTNDLSARNFVHSDFAMLNARLAKHYGIPGVERQPFRRVALPANSHRGGVLCQASILKITANGTGTSPVIRGNWVLNNILGKPVKPPPPDVPAIEPDIRGATTIREQVAKHRAIASCAACHNKMDPLGLALENFDVLGGWRTDYRVAEMNAKNQKKLLRIVGFKPGLPVDAGGMLTDGRKFKDVDELKTLLLADKDAVARCVAGKLLTYATGAGLTFADKIAIENIVQQTADKDHGLRTLLHAVVASESFLRK